MRIAHVMPALTTGGAQAMLAKLLEAGAGGPHQLVVTLRPGGGLWPRIAATGVGLVELGLRPGELSLQALLRLATLLRRWRPDLVHGWMYHGNLAAFLAARLAGRSVPVLWNIRHSLHDLALEKAATRAVIRAGVPLSHLVAGVIYNSFLSADQHRAHGYAHRRAEVIPNGFDTELFRPDPTAGPRLRQQFGLPPGSAIVGIVARYHPMKDHASLVQAASRLRGEGFDLRLVMVGENMTADNAELTTMLAGAGLADQAVLLGERHDVAQLVAGFDVAVLCSAWGEGFPNALGEAMACGVPCIATDVGDCRRLLAAGGIVVTPRNPAELAAALHAILRLPPAARAQLGAAGRQRITREFGLDAIADRYERLYARLTAA